MPTTKRAESTPSTSGYSGVSTTQARSHRALEPLKDDYANGRSLSTAYDSRCGPRLERDGVLATTILRYFNEHSGE